MAPRSLWNGTITFGLVNVPGEGLHGDRVQEHPLPPGAPRPTARGSSTAASARRRTRRSPTTRSSRATSSPTASFVELTKDEIAAAAGENAKLIDVEHFVAGEEIDPAFYDKTYYLGAGDKGEDALPAAARGAREVRARSRSAAGSSTTASGSSPCARSTACLGHAHDELPRRGGRARRPRPAEPAEEPVRARDRDGGQARRSRWQAKFEPHKYKDTYRDAVLELIERKAQGRGDRGARRARASDEQRRPDRRRWRRAS